MNKKQSLESVAHLNLPKDKLDILWDKYSNKKRRTANQEIYDRTGHRVAFLFSFYEWCLVWLPYLFSDGFDTKSYHSSKLVVCRKNDLGDYKIGNVDINTARNNSLEVISRNPVYFKTKNEYNVSYA